MLELAKKINRQGDSFIKKYGINEFHKKAAELLQSSHFPSRYDYQQIVELAFNKKHTQHFKALEFSDMPVTISYGEHCFIDLYFWRRRPTVIHNHHFAGAFMCLVGNNIDSEFVFKKSTKLGRYHDLGELALKQTRRLAPGDIAEIAYMNKFIHQNHHQAELTVNLCFRTNPQTARSLSNYLYSGLRYEKNPELLRRVAQLHRFLDLGSFDIRKISINHDDAISFLIQTYGTTSLNPRLHQIRKFLDQKLKKELNLNILQLMKRHEQKMDEIENQYE
jgi:hypothetical protein